MPPAADREQKAATAVSEPLAFASGACTDIGLDRRTNQDTFFVPPTDSGYLRTDRLWAVADGMGGHSGGGVASRLAVQSLEAFYRRAPHGSHPWSTKALQRHLTETVRRIDRIVRRAALADTSLAHMGTTLSCLLLYDPFSIVAHVGDSRIYRWRRGHLTCLTTDHTFVQEMIDEGEVDPRRAHLHPLRHLLTNVIGTVEPLAFVDTRIDRALPGDRFLLCSDGLHQVLDGAIVSALLAAGQGARTTAERLIDAALEAKTKDNVTALVVDVSEK